MRIRISNALAVVAATAALALSCLFSAPVVARADGFDMHSVNIFATVLEDGRMLVSESRTFDFDDDVNGVFWTIPLGENQQGHPASLEQVSVRATENDQQVNYQLVDSASNGDTGIYTVENDGDRVTIKVFSPHESGEQGSFMVSYIINGAVMAWSDTAELYWKFVGDGWTEPSHDVTLTLGFSGEAHDIYGSDGSVESKDWSSDELSDLGVRAWGHGPLDATVQVGDTGDPVARFTVPRVDSGEYAEARLVFPVSWVPDLQASSSARLETILDEEAAWAEEANARREEARRMVAAATVLSVGSAAVLLVAAVGLRLTVFKSPKPMFQDTYYRDVPSDDHPAVISAFMRDGDVGDAAFVATLMKLTDERVIELVCQTRQKRGLFGSKDEDSYSIRLVDRARATDPIDRDALDLYFGPGAQNGEEVRFDGVRANADEDSDAYGERLDGFKASVGAAIEMRGLLRDSSHAFGLTVVVLAVVIGVASLFATIELKTSVLALLATCAMAIAAAAVAATARRYTREDVELRARCLALKRWLEDFTRLGEAVPQDLILWNKLLVMAVALGVSDKVLRDLADAVPRDMRQDEPGGFYYPVYWWCYPHGSLGSPTRDLSSTYGAISAAALAASANSSSGGFGGGFSGGGGGGVGGGGGGTF